MPSVPSWNVKSGKNISCWACEHFQRYDNGAQPMGCEGECRKDPPTEANDIEVSGGATEHNVFGYFTFVPFGNTNWCSSFQRSLEQNIPANPAPAQISQCANQTYAVMTMPFDYQDNVQPPISKKPIEESCWFCNHWQRFNLDPSIPSPSGCSGFCMQDAAWSATRWQRDFGTGEVVERTHLSTLIKFGAFNWCAKWERNTELASVPAVPDYGQGDCVFNPV